jgi:hypothetical protein
MGMSPRTRLYSGSDRPAIRMNQTGVYGTGSPRQARRKGELACWVGWFWLGWVTLASLPNGPARPGDTPPEIHRNHARTCQDRGESCQVPRTNSH